MKKFTVRTSIILTASAAILALSACKPSDNQSGEDDVEMDIKIDTPDTPTPPNTPDSSSNSASSSSNSSTVTTNGNSKFALKINGTEINVNLPKDVLNDGAKSDDLYPGAKITGINVSSNNDNDNGNRSSSSLVNMEFTAPDAPDKVANYFVKKFKDEGGTASRQGTTVSGKTEDGQDYILKLTPNGSGSNALLSVTGTKG